MYDFLLTVANNKIICLHQVRNDKGQMFSLADSRLQASEIVAGRGSTVEVPWPLLNKANH